MILSHREINNRKPIANIILDLRENGRIKQNNRSFDNNKNNQLKYGKLKNTNIFNDKTPEEKIIEVDISKLEKKKLHDEFKKKLKKKILIMAEFPFIKEKRSISLLNDLEEYIEMQNEVKRDDSLVLDISKYLNLIPKKNKKLNK